MRKFIMKSTQESSGTTKIKGGHHHHHHKDSSTNSNNVQTNGTESFELSSEAKNTLSNE